MRAAALGFRSVTLAALLGVCTWGVGSGHPCVRPVLRLRGAGAPPRQGTKRGRGKSEPRVPASSTLGGPGDSGGESDDESAPPPAKIQRRGWFSHGEGGGLLGRVLAGAKRLFSWSSQPAAGNHCSKGKSRRVVFSGDSHRPTAIQRQIGFYFSDSNLPTDKFLKGQIDKDGEGYVDISIIASFQRMKTLDASVSDIAEAARAVEFLAVSGDGLRVRRTTPVPSEEAILERTVYAKPFRTDDIGKTIENIPKWFAPYGTVKSVRMHRDFREGKQLTGAAFIEFETDQEAFKCTRKTITVEGTVLEVCMKRDWKRIEKAHERAARGLDDALESSKQAKHENKTSANVPSRASKVFVKIEGMGANVTRYNVASTMERYGKVKFVEIKKDPDVLNRHNCSAVVRFERASHARAAIEDYEAGTQPKMDGLLPVFTLIQGEEEDLENEKLVRRTALLNKKVPFWQKSRAKRTRNF